MTDPIADMLARIRNGITSRKAKVMVPASKLKRRIAEVMKEEGFLANVAHESDGKQGNLVLELKWNDENENIINGLRRTSRPGQRSYSPSKEIPKVRSGLGVVILSTSKGVMADHDARKSNLGGELLCEIW